MTSIFLGSKADVFYLEGQTWICKSELTSDVIIEVEDMSFQLHKFPLITRSGILQKMISEFHNNDGKDCILELHDIPGGAKAFELVAKFCYDVKIELNALNVVAIRCASEYLQMTEDHGEGNLIMQTENFLEEVLGDWNDSMKALQTCKDILPYAEELHIVTRCINSLAAKASVDPTLFGWPMIGQANTKNLGGTILWNGIGPGGKSRSPGADWWYKDVAFLDLPTYRRLILAMKSKGMKPDNIAGSLMHYAKMSLPGLSRQSGFQDSADCFSCTNSTAIQSESDQRVLLEEIVELLPMERGVASSKFLLGLLQMAMIIHASPSCRENLERRVAEQLEDAELEDILIPNLGYSIETLYDIDCMQRILDRFVSFNQPEDITSPGIVDEGELMANAVALTPVTMVAKLMDGYLAEVASDVNLKLPKFQSLAALIPDYARQSTDGIYHAIDIYLKSHPWLTDSEREQLCRLMNCQKLSLEACTHAAQNERLPLRVIVQVLFFEQLRLRTTITGWFFSSDNVENSHARMLPKSSSGLNQAEITQEDVQSLSFEEMRSRVSDLEKECSSIREEIQKLERSKSAWSIFSRKLGFGMRTKRFFSSKQASTDR
ncbi:BTB/POZ domain-containing protein At5g03250-like isoform X1 [Musa acuminata AAA Group]|uniref:BTB/POZ domain-containing protein At5g03250-like isoform X1 n=2 Tax=Musa acuminata AAA Group TaxID=214697 RepID=UPI0031E147B7